MSDETTEGLLLQLKEEITSLRRRNEILEARTGVLDLIGRLVMPQTTQGFGVDPVWRIDQWFVNERRQDKAAAKPEPIRQRVGQVEDVYKVPR